VENKRSEPLFAEQQIPLKVIPDNPQTLENFFGSPVVVKHLQRLQAGQQIYLWGEPGSGKSHLLKACCLRTGPYGKRCQYLDLQTMGVDKILPQKFSENALLAVDNLQLLAGNTQAEQTWLEGFEQARALGQRWLLAATQAPARGGFTLPDLVSRLESGTVYRLCQPDDGHKRLALQQRAEQMGFELNEQVLEYLLRRSARDTHALFALLDQIDTTSLALQRKVTVPLLQQLLGTK